MNRRKWAFIFLVLVATIGVALGWRSPAPQSNVKIIDSNNPPQPPENLDSEIGYSKLEIDLEGVVKSILAFIFQKDEEGDHVWSDNKDVSLIFPSWRAVGQPKPVVGNVPITFVDFYGTVTEQGPVHLATVDFPTMHYTHDFTFEVHPDKAYEWLLGWRKFKDGTRTKQKEIEIEWESGVGNGNSGNPATSLNSIGRSFGFYSAGHQRGEQFWNWPTAGDRVYISGQWIWDRGHPPARNEIHPPRLVAVKRTLPEVFALDPTDPRGSSVFATRSDMFASGDGSAFFNNRTNQPNFVTPVPMNNQDYVFVIKHTIPRPGQAEMSATWLKRPGDTFSAAANQEYFPEGIGNDKTPAVRITIPWKTANEPNTSVFARSLYIYWNDVNAKGAASTFKPTLLEVTVDSIQVRKGLDGSDPGEMRIFMDIGGQWYFANEWISNRPVHMGIGSVMANLPRSVDFGIKRKFRVVLPRGTNYRVFASGWEGDGIDSMFGNIRNPYATTVAEAQRTINDYVATTSVYRAGSEDDEIGDVLDTWNYANFSGVGQQFTLSKRYKHDAAGKYVPIAEPMTTENANGTFGVKYSVSEIQWSQAIVPVQNPPLSP